MLAQHLLKQVRRQVYEREYASAPRGLPFTEKGKS